MRASFRLLIAAGLLLQVAAAQTLPVLVPPSDAFQAKALLVLSDADMVPSAYVDGQLGPVAGTDVLSVAAFDGQQAAPSSVQTLPISNSVTGPPAALTVTPDGRYALTVETLGPRTSATRTLAQLLPGRTISVVDLAEPRRPRLVQQVLGPPRARSVSVSADGTLVAVAVQTEGAEAASPLWLYHFQAGRLLNGAAVPIPDWPAGDQLITALFHPSRPLLALTDLDKHTVLFAEVRAATGPAQLTPWGNVVEVEQAPLLTCFSPDGRYFFANATYTAGPRREAGNPMPRGSLVSVQLAARTDVQGAPVHLLTARALTGHTPEGLAVSPNGRYLVTVNLEHNALGPEVPRRTRYATLSLFGFDPATGELTAAGEFAFDGLLNESAVFDNSSRRLAVANFGQLDNPTGPGSIDFWRVVGDVAGPEPLRLVKTNYALSVQRGAHTLSIIR